MILEGIGGIHYAAHDDTFTFADNLPSNWSYMEFRVPVQKLGVDAVTWVTARAERRVVESRKVIKTVTVKNNPFKRLRIQPWAEDIQVTSVSPPVGRDVDPPIGHIGWLFEASNASVTMDLYNRQ